jgi:MFS family permease
VINGLSVGITSSQVPVYLAEITKKEKRGSIIVIQQLAIEWGILIMFFASYGCSFLRGPASFRTAWALQFIPAGVLMLGIPFLPRSPRWLAKVGRSEEAIETLAFIQANGDKTIRSLLLSGKKSQPCLRQSARLIKAGENSSIMACGGGRWLVS